MPVASDTIARVKNRKALSCSNATGRRLALTKLRREESVKTAPRRSVRLPRAVKLAADLGGGCARVATAILAQMYGRGVRIASGKSIDGLVVGGPITPPDVLLLYLMWHNQEFKSLLSVLSDGEALADPPMEKITFIEHLPDRRGA